MLTSIYRPAYQFLSTLLLLLFCLLFTSCTVNVSLPSSGSSATSCLDTTCNTPASGSQPLTGSQHVKVFVEPDMGSTVITDAIDQAQKSVWLEMYLLTDRSVITSLEDAAHRGLDVRVMLEAHPYGGGSLSPAQTLDRLRTAGIKAQPTSPDFALTHEKGMIIDGNTAFIMTANFTLSALGGSKSTKNREYGIIDTDAQDVEMVTAIFNDDWNRSPLQQISDPNVVVSPINARADFLSLIGSAKKTLLIEAEEMQDAQVEQALSAAAAHGVQVQVILPSTKSSSSDSTGSSGGNSAGITLIKQSGVQVEESSRLYMHAKIIVVDGQKAFVGSENISTSSLNRNRELGIIVSDGAVLTTLQNTFQQDWSNSQSV